MQRSMEGSGGERTSALQARLQARREMFLKAEGAGGGGATPSQVGRDFFKTGKGICFIGKDLLYHMDLF